MKKSSMAGLGLVASLLVNSVTGMTLHALAASDAPPQFHTYRIAYNGSEILSPSGFVAGGTTYMSAQDMISVFENLQVKAGYSPGNFEIGTPLPVDILKPKGQKVHIYLNGVQFAFVPSFTYNDATTGKATTYLPIWYMMSALKQQSINTNWNGHQWNIGHLGA